MLFELKTKAAHAFDCKFLESAVSQTRSLDHTLDVPKNDHREENQPATLFSKNFLFFEKTVTLNTSTLVTNHLNLMQIKG